MKKVTRKEWLLLAASIVFTLAITLGALRWFAPGLLGIPIDLQAVRVAEKKPSFYDNVFNRSDYRSQELLIKDPNTRIRAKPLLLEGPILGPHDLLGFRNRSVPNVADVLVLGDSQTYGNNARLVDNWPSRLAARMDSRITTYAMATGGWGATQYLDMFSHGTVFRPRVMIVAFYTGNDPQESGNMAYTLERWKALRIDPNLDLTDRPPSVAFPRSEETSWKVNFSDGVTTVFTPALRMYSNDRRYSTVNVGYKIMAKVAAFIAGHAEKSTMKAVFIIIPTKEFVYAEKIRRDNIKARQDYVDLVEHEAKNIEDLASSIKKLSGAVYVDVPAALQKAALGNQMLYPINSNGHPMATGYDAIAAVVAPVVSRLVKVPAPGLAMVEREPNRYSLALIDKGGYWWFSSEKLAAENGWKFNLEANSKSVQRLHFRDIAGFPYLGVIQAVNKRKFGPK